MGLFARLLLLTRLDQEGVPDIAPVPAGKRPVLNDLGVRYHLDVHVEEGHDLKVA
jgi:hypothetical protein